MALQKQITDERGIVTNYHKIDDLQLYKDEASEQFSYHLFLRVASFTSKEVRDTGATLYAYSDKYDFACDPTLVETQPIYKVAYDLLKTTKTFKDAVDA